MLRAIIFDLDETMRRFLEGQHERLFGSESAADFAATVLSHQDGGYADKRVAYELALQELGRNPADLDNLMDDFEQNYGADAICFPDVPRVLAGLHDRVHMGLISNGRSVGQRAKLASAGIDACFDAIVISGEVGISKPDPAIFLHCMARLNVTAQESIYVGDHPGNDIEPAARLGMKTVWLRNDSQIEVRRADAVIDHIRELPDLIDAGHFET